VEHERLLAVRALAEFEARAAVGQAVLAGNAPEGLARIGDRRPRRQRARRRGARDERREDERGCAAAETSIERTHELHLARRLRRLPLMPFCSADVHLALGALARLPRMRRPEATPA